MRAQVLQFVANLLLAGPVAVLAAPGDVDPGFGYPDSAALPDSTNVVKLPDGWLVVLSRSGELPVEPSLLLLTRTDRDGRIDESYGSMGRRTIALPSGVNVATAVRRLADGSIVLGGRREMASSEGSVGAVVRLDPQGQLDLGFGEHGVATIDVQGSLDQVGAIESLPDGRLALLLWSRLLYNHYDCSEDQTALAILDADGRNARVESTIKRVDFGAGSCRHQMTLQLRSDGTLAYGNELGVFGSAPALPSNWRYGPFVVDTPLGSFFSTVWGTSINVQRLGVDRPVGNADYTSLAAAAGLCGPATWNRFAVDTARQRLYLGVESDGGQVAIARFRLDGSIDTGWGRHGLVAIKGGRCEADWTTVEGLASELRLLSVEPDGDVVIATAEGTIQRLTGGDGTAHGAFTVRVPHEVIREGNYSLQVTVPRLGGATGAVSVNYRVTDCDPTRGLACTESQHLGNARPGEDFVAASGTLYWSDGDATERTIQVQLLDDQVSESSEFFYVELFGADGGAGLLSPFARIFVDNSTPPPATQPGDPASGGGKSSGGGSFSGSGLLLMLVATVLVRRQRSQRTVNPIRRPSP